MKPEDLYRAIGNAAPEYLEHSEREHSRRLLFFRRTTRHQKQPAAEPLQEARDLPTEGIFSMKNENISTTPEKADNALLPEAEAQRKKRSPRYLGWIAIAACLCLAVGLAVPLLKPASAIAARAIREAEYPEIPEYPYDEAFSYGSANAEKVSQWNEYRSEMMAAAKSSKEAVSSFSAATMGQFLSGAENGNRVYSPVNVYLALSMLAELTDGSTRSQILELLDVKDIETLRAQAQNVWKANYCDDGAVTSVLANSVWLNENISFRQDTMDRLAETYRTSSYQGTMGSEEFNKLLQDWLQKQTGGLLDEQAENISMNRNTVIALASTLYFRGRWANEFWESETHEDIFHAPDGEKTVEFMYQEMASAVYWGENFRAVKLPIRDGGAMWLILPDEGCSVDDVLANDETFAMTASENWENSKSANIRLSMPKFDVDSQMDLCKGLKALGITDAFEDSISDFTPTSRDMDHLYVSKINHAARVCVDEEGCEAAAFTVIMVDATGALIANEIDFTLDRPFVFILTGVTNQPLFAGVVNQP